MMDAGETIILLSVLVPVLGASLCLALGKRSQIIWIVAGTSVSASLAAVLLLAYMVVNGVSVITIDAADLFPMAPAIQVLEFLLTFAFLYLGLRLRSPWAVIFVLFDLAMISLISVQEGFGEADPVILVDNLSLILVLVTSLIGPVIALYALRYMEHDPRRPRFFAVILLFMGAMNGAVISNDMLWLLFFWGVTTLCSYLLIGHNRTDEAKAAARWALIVNLGGGAAIVAGAALALHYYGTMTFSSIPLLGLGGLALLPLSLMAIGAFTKSAQVPFQSWLLRGMVAPTPVSALLHSSTMVNLGVYLLIRLSPNFSGQPALALTIALVGGLSFLATSILAIGQSNAKGVLAYSTVGNLGLIAMSVGVSTPLAITAALILLLYHAISKAMMFLAVGVVKEERNTEDIEGMSGLRTRMPFVSLAIFVGATTIVLPPFGMFASKRLISEAALAFPFLIFLLAAGFAAIVVFYFKWIGAILSADPAERPTGLRHDPTSRWYKWTIGSLMAAAVGLSVLIGPVIRHIIDPYVNLYSAPPVGTGGPGLFTFSGELPALLLLIIVAVALLGLAFRPKDDRVYKPYAGGEDFAFEPAGTYYLGVKNADLITRVAEAAGVLLIVALVLVPVLLEVL